MGASKWPFTEMVQQLVLLELAILSEDLFTFITRKAPLFFLRFLLPAENQVSCPSFGQKLFNIAWSRFEPFPRTNVGHLLPVQFHRLAGHIIPARSLGLDCQPL